jgi:hypothetical protein
LPNAFEPEDVHWQAFLSPALRDVLLQPVSEHLTERIKAVHG